MRCPVLVMEEEAGPALNFLWVIDVDYSTRHHHGAILRYVNYSRQLIAAGHRVYFIVRTQSADFGREKEFFQDLKNDRAITDFFPCSYLYPRWKARMAALSTFPSLANRWLAADQDRVFEYCRGLAQRLDIDVCVFSNRELFFLAPRFRKILPSIIDFGDSWTLYRLREMRLLWSRRALGAMLAGLRYLAEWYLKERYYSRLADSNITVSPVDKAAFDKISGRPEKNYILLNGVLPGKGTADIQKVKGRLIFSGNMDFPPNYESAIWLIDQVLPQVFRTHPDAHLVVAGANPVPELLRRASDRIRVTGFVEDMAAEVAASSLFVAPMIMGGGFKNKVVEALINRTYVAGTPMAVEFLGQDAVDQMLVADSAESLARQIIRFLSHPEEFEYRLAYLHEMVSREFSWEHRTAELLDIVRNVLRERHGADYDVRTPASSSAK